MSVGGVYGVFMQVLTFKQLAKRITYKKVFKSKNLFMQNKYLLIYIADIEIFCYYHGDNYDSTGRGIKY